MSVLGAIYNRTTDDEGSAHENVIKTSGLLISDDLATAKNDLGFRYYTQVQRITGSNSEQVFDAAGNFTGLYATVPNPENEGLPENIGAAFGIPPAQITVSVSVKI